jgi:hypothetical protein
MNRIIFLFFICLFLSCVSTQTIIIPLDEYRSYKQSMAERGEKIIKLDTLIGAEKMIKIYYQDIRKQ